jgi:hypothetical protein
MPAERTLDRMPSRKLIEYTIVVLKDGRLKFMDLTGRAINISANGLCFFTKYPLKAGCVVEFKDKVLQAKHGVVMWIRRIGGFYIAGTRLIRRNAIN